MSPDGLAVPSRRYGVTTLHGSPSPFSAFWSPIPLSASRPIPASGTSPPPRFVSTSVSSHASSHASSPATSSPAPAKSRVAPPSAPLQPFRTIPRGNNSKRVQLYYLYNLHGLHSIAMIGGVCCVGESGTHGRGKGRIREGEKQGIKIDTNYVVDS